MECVELVGGHAIEQSQDELFVEEVASDVDHQTAVDGARRVIHAHLPHATSMITDDKYIGSLYLWLTPKTYTSLTLRSGCTDLS